MLILLAVSLFGTISCEQSCTLVACASTLDVTLGAIALEPGSYALQVEGLDWLHACEFEIGADLSGPLTCADEAQQVAIGNHGTLAARFYSLDKHPPAQVEVRLSRGGVELLRQSADTVFGKTFHPNGEECGPACRSGSVAIE